MHVDEYLTYVKNVEDVPYLTEKARDVNMRLFNCNRHYHSLVLACCAYLRFVALSNLEGYSRPFGMSGANLAIPFNIIGVVTKRGTPAAYCRTMINPKITKLYGQQVLTRTNCGSIRLPKSIDVLRNTLVDVTYFDENGLKYENQMFTREDGAFTIQHEVDHNLGILITDRVRK